VSDGRTAQGAHGLPIDDPVEAMPGTKRAILAAARRVLREHGFEGLTIEAVANEANVSRTSIPYHFGSRAGLVEILIDSLFHDFAVEIWKRRDQRAGEGSVDDFLEMARLEVADTEGQREFFELMVCALRENVLGARVADLFTGYRQINVELAGLSGATGAGSEDGDASAALGGVLQAILDGLALQKAVDPDFDVEAAIAEVRRLLGGAPPRTT
jgi:TetR/AcrR family transcriptional repressor of bet genes